MRPSASHTPRAEHGPGGPHSAGAGRAGEGQGLGLPTDLRDGLPAWIRTKTTGFVDQCLLPAGQGDSERPRRGSNPPRRIDNPVASPDAYVGGLGSRAPRGPPYEAPGDVARDRFAATASPWRAARVAARCTDPSPRETVSQQWDRPRVVRCVACQTSGRTGARTEVGRSARERRARWAARESNSDPPGKSRQLYR